VTSFTFTRSVLAVLAAGALTVPVAAEAKGGPGKGHDRSSVTDRQPRQGHDKPNPMVMYTFKGTVVSVDGAAGTAMVKVAKTNHHGRFARNSTMTFDLSAARISVADVNADGLANVADVTGGDKVLVKARLPKRSPEASGTVVARALVDQTHPEADTDAGSAG
jgi:hypothetical protein